MRMRIFPILLALVASAVVLVPAVAAPAAGRGPLASVRVVECVREGDLDTRSATFRGSMRRVAGTQRMSMRFVLHERTGNGRWTKVAAPGLGVWRKSRPGVRRFAYRQRVLALAEGSAYRVGVGYRWFDADGEVLRRAARRSRPCRQPGGLPDLEVVRIGAQPLEGTPGRARYTVHVANRGSSAAKGFEVLLRVDGEAAGTPTVDGLGPGERRRVFFDAPSCAGGVEARVDPADSVRESDELDNSLSAPCPLVS